jgi:hypothetical protein
MNSVEPFLYRDIIKEKSDNIIIEETIPEFEKIVLEADEEWGGENNSYYTIIYKDNEYKMYYRANQGSYLHKSWESVCLATSNNGLDFKKSDYYLANHNNIVRKIPTHSGIELHCVMVEPIKNMNNKLFHNKFCHNFFPYYSEKEGYYIALSGTIDENGGLFLLKSLDGIHWDPVMKILDSSHVRSGFNHANHFDTCNTITYNSNEDIYYILIRDNRPTIENGKHIGRRVQYTKMCCERHGTSRIFKVLDKCKSIIINNNTSNYPIYSFGCCHYPYSKYYISIPTLVDENYINGKWEQKKKIGQLLVSRNCYEWNIVSENIYKKNMGEVRFNAIGIVPSPNKDKLYFYVQNNFMLPNMNIECYSFPMNRINQIKCNEEGYIKTDVINLISNKIEVNFETTKEDGYIVVHIYDENNNLVLFSSELSGNHLELPVSWREEKDLDKGIYFIEFKLYKCILFSFSYIS